MIFVCVCVVFGTRVFGVLMCDIEQITTHCKFKADGEKSAYAYDCLVQSISIQSIKCLLHVDEREVIHLFIIMTFIINYISNKVHLLY